MAATKLLENGIGRFGLFGSLRWNREGLDLGERFNGLVSAELDARLEDAMTIVEHRHDKVELLTRILVRERVMSGARVTEIMSAKRGREDEPIRMKPSYLTLVGGNDHDEF